MYLIRNYTQKSSCSLFSFHKFWLLVILYMASLNLNILLQIMNLDWLSWYKRSLTNGMIIIYSVQCCVRSLHCFAALTDITTAAGSATTCDLSGPISCGWHHIFHTRRGLAKGAREVEIRKIQCGLDMSCKWNEFE